MGPRKNIENARKVQLVMGADFSREYFMKKSLAAGEMVTWVRNISAYYVLAAPPAPPAPPTSEQQVEKTRFTLAKGDIVELKAAHKPPAGVIQVLAVVGLLLNGVKMDWKGCKSMLADPVLVQRMIEIDVKQVPPSALAEARRLAAEPGFNVRSIKAHSCAAAGVAEWVLDVLEESKNDGDARA